MPEQEGKLCNMTSAAKKKTEPGSLEKVFVGVAGGGFAESDASGFFVVQIFEACQRWLLIWPEMNTHYT